MRLCRPPPRRVASASSSQCPCQESNLVYDLRRVACCPLHFKDHQYPTEESNLARLLRRQSCVLHTRRAIKQYPDLESNQGLDLRRVQCNPLHHRDQQEPTTGFAPACFRLQDGRLSQSSHVGSQHEREDSNPIQRLWRPPALPGARSCKAAETRDLGGHCHSSSSTVQYASLRNLDQLSIRTSCRA